MSEATTIKGKSCSDKNSTLYERDTRPVSLHPGAADAPRQLREGQRGAVLAERAREPERGLCDQGRQPTAQPGAAAASASMEAATQPRTHGPVSSVWLVVTGVKDLRDESCGVNILRSDVTKDRH